jgi:glycosyltransferase involved in cell wall biosynthesis
LTKNLDNINLVIITPARNEEDYIEQTIKSVISQTLLPKMWVIVSDGSTDNTDTIVKKYVKQCNYIKLLSLPEKKERHFAAKAEAIKAGIQLLKEVEYNLLCIIDADISFDSDYFKFLTDKFKHDDSLGLAGTDYIEGGFHSSKDSYISESHVNGACQLFRRECWEEIGGYTPIKGGGIDWVAVMTARMKGWKTHSFKEKTFNHLRPIGTAEANKFKSRYMYGKKDYFLGGHPIWQLFRVLFTMTKRPYFFGGFALFIGYMWSWTIRLKRPIHPDLIKFHRKEQMGRLKAILQSKILLFNRDNSKKV